jgi:1-aminocyclopropane-1-carboxylate deaminase/D-cysteine desulfhydrase-like pyridoxal-dependent ACC family enzyme
MLFSMEHASNGSFPLAHCSLLPTPFHRLDNISRLLEIDCWCKRDDLTGFALGGNKTRKLDYLVGDALARGCTAIVTAGAVQSNFCRMAAAAGKVHGLSVHLVLGGKLPTKPAGNLLIDQLFDADITFIDSPDWDVWETEADQLADHLTERGGRICRLPIGGSTPVGALGYADCFHEIMIDAAREGIDITRIIHATSSGGTQAGLLAGKAQSGWHGTVIGMGVAKDAGQLTGEISALAAATGKLLGVATDPRDVIVDQRAMGAAYGLHTPAADDAIRLFAGQEGIILDGVYTGKAAAGLIAMASGGEIRRGETVVFLHTGGSMELFA